MAWKQARSSEQVVSKRLSASCQIEGFCLTANAVENQTASVVDNRWQNMKSMIQGNKNVSQSLYSL